MEKLSKSTIKRILTLKIIGYVFFGLWFFTAMVMDMKVISYVCLALCVLALISSTVLYTIDYQKRRKKQ